MEASRSMTEALPRAFCRDEFSLTAYLILAAFAYEGAIFGPMMPFLRAEMHFGYLLASLHFAAWSLGSMLAGLLGDKICMRLGRAGTVWLSLVFVCVEIVALISAANPYVTLGVSFLLGSSGALIGQSLFSMLAEKHQDLKSVAIAESATISVLTCSFSPLLLSFAVKWQLGWRAAVFLPVLVFLSLFLCKRSALGGFPETADSNKKPEALPGLSRAYWTCWLLIFLAVAGEWSIIYWAADFCNQVLKLSKADSAATVSLFLSAMVIGRFFGSRFSREIDIRSLLKAAAVTSLLGFLLFWQSKSVLLALSGLFIAGLGISNFYPMTLSLAIESAPQSHNKAIARVYLATGGATLFLPVLLGKIADSQGIYQAFSVVSLLLLICLFMVFAPIWEQKKTGTLSESSI